MPIAYSTSANRLYLVVLANFKEHYLIAHLALLYYNSCLNSRWNKFCCSPTKLEQPMLVKSQKFTVKVLGGTFLEFPLYFFIFILFHIECKCQQEMSRSHS